MTLRAAAGTDLMALTAELVDIPSVSHDERAVADFVEAWLRGVGAGYLDVERIGDNVCARTSFGLDERLLLAGHLDTVPANGNERAHIEGDVMTGVGSADMKGGVSVFLEVARAVCSAAATSEHAGPPAGLRCDLTWIFYICEEVERRYSGLPQIEAAAPAWLDAHAAILGEPTVALVEAGCQGVLKIGAEVWGERAHTARPWMGANAIHGLAPILAAVASYEGRRPVIDGCEYREALQAVSIEGGVANNVVPDLARVVLNHRFAPDRSAEEAFQEVFELLVRAAGPDLTVTVVAEDSAAPAAPGLEHPLLARLVEASGNPPRAKLGWTDVSFFSSRGVPAANFGPGDPTLAHSAGECVDRAQLDRALGTLCSVVG